MNPNPTNGGLVNEKTKTKALEILEGMRTIANAEMLTKGVYLTEHVVDPNREGAICRGHKACAIGSLWLAAGVKVEKDGDGYHWLPGVEEDEREDFLRNRRYLRAAHKALNEAASAYMASNNILAGPFDDPIEALFESSDRQLVGDERRKAMLKVISAAKRKLKTA